jgi:hypothetical protein
VCTNDIKKIKRITVEQTVVCHFIDRRSRTSRKLAHTRTVPFLKKRIKADRLPVLKKNVIFCGKIPVQQQTAQKRP